MATVYRPSARQEGLVLQELDGELLVYALEEHEAHCLNETTALVWRACDGERSVAEIALRVGLASAEDVVWLALEELSRLRLLDGDPLPARSSHLSRRSLLRRGGLALALPAVASLAVPAAAAAASCSGIGGPCTSDLDCCPSQTAIVNCNIGQGVCEATA